MTRSPSARPRSGSRWRAGLGALGVALLAGACSETAPLPTSVDDSAALASQAPRHNFGQRLDACGLTVTARLLVDKRTHVGNVTVLNDADSVYIRYDILPGWEMQFTAATVVVLPKIMPPSPTQLELERGHGPKTRTHVFAIARQPEWEAGRAMVHTAATARVRSSTAQNSRWVAAEAEGVQLLPDLPDYVIPHRLQGCTGDAVFIGDASMFDNIAMQNPGNQRFVWNTVALLTRGLRYGDKVWFDRGRGSACAAATLPNGQPNPEQCSDQRLAGMRQVITWANFTIENKAFAPGQMTEIPMDVRVIFFWTPRGQRAFTLAEVNLLRRFTAEGGRIVYISEWNEAYGPMGFLTSNAWLEAMGSGARNVGAGTLGAPLYDCATQAGYPVTGNVQRNTFQQGFTVDVADIRLACASRIDGLGEADRPLIWDRAGENVLAAVVQVDTRGTGALRTTLQPVFSTSGTQGGSESGVALGSGVAAN